MYSVHSAIIAILMIFARLPQADSTETPGEPITGIMEILPYTPVVLGILLILLVFAYLAFLAFASKERQERVARLGLFPSKLKVGNAEAEWRENQVGELEEGEKLDADAGEMEGIDEPESVMEDVEEEKPDKKNEFDLLEEGEYEAAIEYAKANDEAKLNKSQRVAFIRYRAVAQGVHNALSDLEADFEKRREDAIIASLMVGAYREVGKSKTAGEVGVEVLESLVDDKDQEEERTVLLREVSGALCELGKYDDAENLIRTQVRNLESPHNIAKSYGELALVYDEQPDPDREKAQAIRELALKFDPSNTSIRFKIAYTYSGEKPDHSLCHYFELFRFDPDHSTALNNAGVAAGNLSLPGIATEYYLKSWEKGNTLAASNIAYKLIDAGFYDRATEILEEANKGENVNRNVGSAIGKVSKLKASEDGRSDDIRNNFSEATKWLQRYGEALLEENTYDNLQGIYEANTLPAYSASKGLEFEISDGKITCQKELGVFDSKVFELEGELEGRGIIINWWVSEDDEAGHDKSGTGILIVNENSLSGYYVEDKEDESELETFTSWRLKKQE